PRGQYPCTGGPPEMRIMCKDSPLSVELEPCIAVVLLPIVMRSPSGTYRIYSAASPPSAGLRA
ncbi:hypothetical protein BGZ88_012055, partial [Linnemannia elongata]